MWVHKYGVSIYVNNIQKVTPEEIELLPNLAFHDISNFVSFLKKEYQPKEIIVSSFPTEESLKTMIHLVL